MTAFSSAGFRSDLTPYLAMPAGLAEMLFLLWLLVVGIRLPRAARLPAVV